jgi:two-component system sensor histidine kinase KdpD
MKRESEIRVWMVTGAAGALALGVGLMPLRTVTSASSLAFVFLGFTIIIAELGGRGAALVTALVSAMSLNYFLTEPYLTLAISKRDDLIAFVALAVCGLIAAAFGTRRHRLSEVVDRADEELGVLKKLVQQLGAGAPLEMILGDLKTSFGLKAIVLRDAGERLLAAAPAGSTPASVPDKVLTHETLFPADDTKVRFGVRGLRLPEGGGRLSLSTDRGSVSLDLWEGDARGFSRDEGRTLAIAASVLALGLSRRQG